MRTFNEDGIFRTRQAKDEFIVKIRQESNWSLDGGHSFEIITNAYSLNKEEANDLIAELKRFLSSK